MDSFHKDQQPLAGDRLERHIARALQINEPTGRDVDLIYRIVKRVFKPMVCGAERIPDRPCLFVGNHSLFALDGMVLGPIMQHEIKRFVRPMGDKFLWANPAVGARLLRYGAVMGHPEVCSALMAEGEDLLVFPGGAHEAVKPESQRYQLQWKERYGFVKLAAKHGYTIMPVGLVGPDEFYNHYIESEELPDTVLGQLLRRLGLIDDGTRSDVLPPVPLGALGSILPKPQRCFIGFGKPVDLQKYRGRTPTVAQQRKIRQQAADEIEHQLCELLRVREQHRRENGLLRRLLTL